MKKVTHSSEFRNLESCNDFPRGIKLEDIEPYLLFMPGRFENTTSDYQAKLLQHLQEAVSLLTKNIVENQELIEKQKEHCKTIGIKPIEIPPINCVNRRDVIKYKVLAKRMTNLTVKLEAINLESLERLNNVFNDLLVFTNWLLMKPRLIFINLKRAMPGASALTYAADQKLFREQRAVRNVLRDQVGFLNNFPPLFKISSENKHFLRMAVDTAVGNRKGNSPYFEESAIDDCLFTFLDCPSSPLAKAKLIPLQIPNSTDSVFGWISEATTAVVKYDNIESTERREAISIYVMRYLFSRTYPLFKPKSKHDPGFCRVMRFCSKKTPTQANIQSKFIPKGYENKSLKEMFNSSSIAKAPLEWLNLVQFMYCPVDMAYCISKVHESLSLMTTLQATNGQTPQDFFAKVPGFDDIIDVWIALVCCSDLADPKSIYDFISKWSRLPGFPSRFMACCAYLEASADQIASHIPSTLQEEEETPKPMAALPDDTVIVVREFMHNDDELDPDNPLGI
jgi:hypothetical protein